MEPVQRIVRSQLIPLQGMSLILPNTCIAEVIAYHQPAAPATNAPIWLLGNIDWRGIRIPVISFEAINERADSPSGAGFSKTGRIAVLNGIGGDATLPFYGIVTQGIPRLITMDETSIHAIDTPDSPLPLALQQAMVAEQSVVIPNQDQLESQLKANGVAVVQDTA
jgi:chemosensory pili system protein ChpC